MTLDAPPPWVRGLTDVGISFLGSSAARTLSPYTDADAGRRLTYLEVLFEWTEGSDGPDGSTLVDSWHP